MQRPDAEQSFESEISKLNDLLPQLHGKFPPPWLHNENNTVLNDLIRNSSAWKSWKLDAIPLSVIHKAANKAFSLYCELKPFEQCSIQESEKNRRKYEDLAERAKMHIDEWFLILVQLSAYATILGDESQKWRMELAQNLRLMESARTRAESIHSEYIGKVNKLSAEVNMVARTATDTLANMGLQAFSGTFKNRVYWLNIQSWIWLGVGVATLIAAVLTAYKYSSLIPSIPIEWNVANFQYVITRLLVVGSLIGFSVWSLRMYRVNRHLAEVYQHRALALQTFRLFARNAGLDEKSRDHLMRAATNAVFNMGPTGLLSPNAEEAEGVISMFERANSAIKK